MSRIITAAFTSAVAKTAPGELVYIPVGSSKINASVSGKPGSVTVNVPPEKGESIAAALQAALTDRLSSTVRPRLAFDHAKTGPASGHPESFSFDPARGIILTANWSNSGRAAIEGGDYGYFSPTFLIDENGVPSGLPDKGEIGSLVDEPAFRTIGLIAASDTLDQTNTNTMSKLIFAALSISASDENAEAEAVSAINALTTANAALKGKVEAAEAEAFKTRKDRAETLVKAAVMDGRILPKDEDKQAKFLAKIEAGETFAEEILAELPKLNEALEKPIVMAADGKPMKSEARVEAAQSKARAELGNTAGFAQVWARATEIDPAAFEG